MNRCRECVRVHRCTTSGKQVYLQRIHCLSAHTPLTHLTNTPYTPLIHPLYMPYTPLIHPSHTPHTPRTRPSSTPYTPLIHPLYTAYTPLTHPSATPVTALGDGVRHGGDVDAGRAAVQRADVRRAAAGGDAAVLPRRGAAAETQLCSPRHQMQLNFRHGSDGPLATARHLIGTHSTRQTRARVRVDDAPGNMTKCVKPHSDLAA